MCRGRATLHNMAQAVIAQIGPKEYDRQIRSYLSKQLKRLTPKDLQNKLIRDNAIRLYGLASRLEEN